MLPHLPNIKTSLPPFILLFCASLSRITRRPRDCLPHSIDYRSLPVFTIVDVVGYHRPAFFRCSSNLKNIIVPMRRTDVESVSIICIKLGPERDDAELE